MMGVVYSRRQRERVKSKFESEIRDGFNTKFRDIHKNFKLEKPLFHYTTARGLLGILEDGGIRGTHYLYMNDKSEGQYSTDQMVKLLKQEIEEIPDGEHIKYYLKYIIKSFEKQSLKFKKTKIYFVASLSEKGNMLSQWRGYSNGGTGYSLGLNFGSLSNVHIGLPRVESSDSYLVPVIYSPREQKALVKALLGVYGEISAKYWLDFKPIIEKVFTQVMLKLCLELSLLFKNNSFREEKEWRLVQIVDRVADTFKFRQNSRYIIPYALIKLQNEHNHLPIEKIITGPGIDHYRAKSSIELLLKSIKYDGLAKKIRITKSMIPFEQF